MADNTVQNGTDILASDHLSLYNGAAITPDATTPKVQRVKIGYGDENQLWDVGFGYPLPVNVVVTSSNVPSVSATLTAAGLSTLAGTTSSAGAAVITLPVSGNVSFQLTTSAFVGTIVFEQSFDPTGAAGTWGPVTVATSDGLSAPTQSLTINTAAAYLRQYGSAVFGAELFRMRVSAFTSGTLSVLLKAGAASYEPSPALGPSAATIGTVLEPARTNVTLNYTATAPVVADTLLTLALNRGGAASSVNTVPVTAGKTLRVTAVMVNLRATAGTLPFGLATLRVNYSGAAVLASPVALYVAVSGNAAVAGNTGTTTFTMGDGVLDLTGTAQLGVSFSNNVTSNVANISVVGYEF